MALPIFMFMRWDSVGWLSTQIQQTAKDAGYHMAYEKFGFSGLGLNFKHLSVSKANMQTVQLDSFNISFSFSALFSGADIETTWQGNPISFTIERDNNLISLSEIEAVMDVSQLQNLNLPAQLSGLVQIEGDIIIAQDTGLPVSGNIHATWNKAMAGLSTPEFTLGDYQIDLHSTEQSEQPWQWKIAGGDGVAIQASGTVLPNHRDAQYWPIQGIVETQVGNTNPSLTMMMQTMMGSNQAKLSLSGSLGAPKMDIVR